MVSKHEIITTARTITFARTHAVDVGQRLLVIARSFRVVPDVGIHCGKARPGTPEVRIEVCRAGKVLYRLFELPRLLCPLAHDVVVCCFDRTGRNVLLIS